MTKIPNKGFNSPQSKESDIAHKHQREIEKLKDSAREERFCWIVVCMILFDCFAFVSFKDWGASLSILILEILLLLVMARKHGVEDLIAIIDKIANFHNNKNK